YLFALGRAVSLLLRVRMRRAVGSVYGLVVSVATLPQGPDNLHPTVGQGAKCPGAGMSSRHLRVEVGSCPGTMPHTLAGEVVSRLSQRVRAGTAEFDGPRLATTAGDRCGSCNGLQGLRGREAAAVIADPGQHPGGSQGAMSTGQTTPPVGFRMRAEHGGDILFK